LVKGKQIKKKKLRSDLFGERNKKWKIILKIFYPWGGLVFMIIFSERSERRQPSPHIFTI